MSTLDANLDAVVRPVTTDDLEITRAREAVVGDMSVRRLLPLRLRRSVGAWCFIDHYGPMSVDGHTGMAVPPHPHIGLQTVTWLMAGDVLHRDSLGSEQMIRPGQLNLMTAGRGIAHAEESPVEHDPELHGVQLWVALPDASRLAEPAFEHHAELPVASTSGLTITVMAGELAGLRSPATTFSELVGAELAVIDDVIERISLTPAFEHVVFVTSGAATVAGTDLAPGSMLYLPPGHERLPLTAAAGTTLMLLGGVPLGEQLLMWWNFVARTPQEIAAAVAGWQQGMFGEVGGYAGDPLTAPALDISRLSRRYRAQEQ
ncbi:MAG TPA: pirin family protein [Streptosporangiaceae bacterium]|nr:pirin family protein [Streptosporangiaceae bacterium]